VPFEPATIRVELDPGPDSDAEELDRLSLELREDLLALDVEAVERAEVQGLPTGAKGSGPGAAGTLIITLANSTVVVALIGILRSWLSRGSGRKVQVRFGGDTILVTDASAEEQAKLIEWWIDAHTGN
jgi:membrane-associated two-gene conflict system component 1 (EACC1)